jgi:predicted DsbA family dithiol-disulfide isomerase
VFILKVKLYRQLITVKYHEKTSAKLLKDEALIQLDIYSDPICPWCYIGKIHLERALETLNENPFHIKWHPFQLNPEMPKNGMDRKKYLEQKFGSISGFASAYRPVIEHTKKFNIDLKLDKIQTTPNTMNAHRIINWAVLEDCQNKIVSELFKAYFVNGLDIGNNKILAKLASKYFMDEKSILRLLNSDNDISKIIDKDRTARRMGIKAVPMFIVADQYAVSGAQTADLWQTVVKDIQASVYQ